MENKGIIPRPRAIPRGSQGSRWYRDADIEAIAAILDGGAVDLGEEGEGERRPSADYARPGRRRARQQVDVDDEEEWTSPTEEWAGARRGRFAKTYRGRAVPPLQRRADLGDAAGRAGFRLLRHGIVDLRMPQEVEGTCVRCEGEVLWQVDATVPGGFAPFCDRCGVTEVHPPRVEEREREKRCAASPGPGAAAEMGVLVVAVDWGREMPSTRSESIRRRHGLATSFCRPTERVWGDLE